MKQEALKNFDLTWLPVTGLIIFFSCFLLYTYWTMKKSNHTDYIRASWIPLDDGDMKQPKDDDNEK